MLKVDYNWEYGKKFEPVFDFKKRFIALTGGRNSGKSWFLAHFFLTDWQFLFARRQILSFVTI